MSVRWGLSARRRGAGVIPGAFERHCDLGALGGGGGLNLAVGYHG